MRSRTRHPKTGRKIRRRQRGGGGASFGPVSRGHATSGYQRTNVFHDSGKKPTASDDLMAWMKALFVGRRSSKRGM